MCAHDVRMRRSPTKVIFIVSTKPIPDKLDLHLDLFGKDKTKLEAAAKRQGLYYLDVEPERMAIRAVLTPADEAKAKSQGKPGPEPGPMNMSTHGDLYILGLGW